MEGRPRNDESHAQVIVLSLQGAEHAETKISIASAPFALILMAPLMNKIDFKDFPWIAPWQPISSRGREAYEHELRLELSLSHPLFEVRATAIARTSHGDDVLFLLHDHGAQLAVVHLTFQSRPEPEAKWPSVVFYRDLDHWIMRGMLRDAARYEIDQSGQAA
jgi:hypothetical protein